LPEDFFQLPDDSTGKKVRTRSRVVGANTVHEQAFYPGSLETWVAYVDSVAFALNKQHVTIFNATGTGKIVKVRKLFAVNLQTAAVTGVVARFDIKRATAASAGTTTTPNAMDTANAALPAGITVRTNGTVTEGPLLFPWITTSEEETQLIGLSKAMYQAATNILVDGPEVQELTLRENQGLTVKQITNTIVGLFGWIVVFTIDA
jgi:hypothetical protein